MNLIEILLFCLTLIYGSILCSDTHFAFSSYFKYCKLCLMYLIYIMYVVFYVYFVLIAKNGLNKCVNLFNM